MKKSLLTLGAITAIAVPVAITVSCGVGNFIKDKIKSAEKAEEVVNKMLNELKEDGTLKNDTLYYQEYGTHNSGDNVWVQDGYTRDSWKNMDFRINETRMWEGGVVSGWADWTSSHTWMWTSTPVTLKHADGTTEEAQAVILYKYEKTHGGVWFGRNGVRNTLIANAGAAIWNAVHQWEHLIVGTTLIKGAWADEQTAENAFNQIASKHYR